MRMACDGGAGYCRRMDIILVPGFWLDASSWSEVTPPLVAAGHRVHPLTLPGLESVDAARTGVGLREHIDALVAVIDSIENPDNRSPRPVGERGAQPRDQPGESGDLTTCDRNRATT